MKMKIITCLLILAIDHGPPRYFCTVTTYLSRSSYLWAIRKYCHSFWITFFSLPYHCFYFPLLSETTPSRGTGKRNPIEIAVTIISHVRGSGPIRQIDERFCVSGKRISHFLDRISEHSKEFSFSFSLYTFLYRLEKILFPIVFNFPGLHNQAARLSCAFCDICCILEEDRNIGIAFCSMFFPRGLPGNRYSN